MKKTSLPHAPNGTVVWATNVYDALGRTRTVTSSWDSTYKEYVYSDNTVTAYDEERKWKKYWFDGLGNLVQVNEPNPTDAGHDAISIYTYDALGHLTNVDLRRWNAIAGVYEDQYRTFTYGMTQLSHATNPENGTVNYGYANGLLSWKTDAKGGKVEYSYDAYNRVSQIRHYPAEYPFSGVGEDTCQRVDFTYDSNPDSGFTYLAGRLATRTYSVCVQPNGGAGASAKTTFTESYGYTQGGQPSRKRLRVSRQLTNQYQQIVTVQRDLDGSWGYTAGRMTSVTYPAGSSGPAAGTYTVGYDSMDRPNTLNDGVGPAVVSGVSYGVAGQLLSVSGLYTETRRYDERLRLLEVNGATFTYKVNGRIETETVGIEQITYQYDALNRLIASSSNQGWSQGYNYDGYGNLTAKTGVNAPTFTAGYDLYNHQIGFTFDANGNQLVDLQGVSASYDVENRIAWVTKVATAVGNGYGYDPDNRRVYFSKWGFDQSAGEWRVTAGGGYEEVVYYGVTGQRMGTYRLSADLNGLYLAATGYNVWFGSRLVRKVAGDGTYTTVQADRLGSFGKYFAYGEQRGTGTADNTEKFATYYRDGDTGLDYAVNRYYASGWGRFLSPDPYRANTGGAGDVGHPGSWNRYAYVVADPVRFDDPVGLLAADPDTGYCAPEFTYEECYGAPGGGGGGPIVGGGGPIGFRTVTKEEREAYETAMRVLLAAASAAGASEQQDGQAYPKYLKVSSDRYTCRGTVVERDVSYDLYDSEGRRMTSGVVTETLFPTDTVEPIITRPALNQSASEPFGQFNDQISIQLGKAREYDQTFSVHGATLGLAGFLEIPVYVVGFGGEYGILHVIKTGTYVEINGNRGTPKRCN